MKVKMRQAIVGRVDGHWSPAPGAEIDVSDEAGALLCAKGFAEPVVEDNTEKAVAPQGEKRAARTRKTAKES
jgi:hypothetical protein